MIQYPTDEIELSQAPRREGEFRRVFKILAGRKVVLFSMVIILILILTAILAPVISPYDPYEQHRENRLAGPSMQHLLGTDTLGRDMLSRIIYGSQTALMVGLVAICIAAAIGVVLGLSAGYFGGMTYVVIMRFVDALMSIPLIVSALVLAALLGGGLINIMIAVGIGMSSTYTRIICGMTLKIKENDFIMAGRAIGASNIRIMLKHCLPNCYSQMIVLMTINMGGAIMVEAALSYLGVGIQPPGAAWGSMIQQGVAYLTQDPILALVPGVAIMVVVYAFNIFGDGLRDALDPRLRGLLQ
jgi:peptide/nickel transport system permease protein